MIETSIPKSARTARVCADCGEVAKNLTAARTAKSVEEARALPLYCPRCNPRRRDARVVIAMLERMGA